MINSFEKYRYPGMSKKYLYRYANLYGCIFNFVCKPKKSILFNDDMLYEESNYYFGCRQAESIGVLYSEGYKLGGLIYLTEDEFKRYFDVIEEDS